jgi:hypothetical protein
MGHHPARPGDSLPDNTIPGAADYSHEDSAGDELMNGEEDTEHHEIVDTEVGAEEDEVA